MAGLDARAFFAMIPFLCRKSPSKMYKALLHEGARCGHTSNDATPTSPPLVKLLPSTHIIDRRGQKPAGAQTQPPLGPAVEAVVVGGVVGQDEAGVPGLGGMEIVTPREQVQAL